jgi:hypothetical protein
MATTGVQPAIAERGALLGLSLADVVCLLSAGLTVGCFFVLGIGVRGDTGAEVTEGLVDGAPRYQIASIMAVFAAMGLGVAAVRLGGRISGQAGVVATASGVAVAFLLAAYYSAHAAGASVASFVIDDPGPGVGEATLVLLNGVELARYAPGLLLVAAALAARRRLPRSSTVPAWILLVVTLVPLTTWIAALLVPLWLGVSAAFVPKSSSVVARVGTRAVE